MSSGVVEPLAADETFKDTREPGIYYDNPAETANVIVETLESQIIPWSEVRDRIKKAKAILPGWYYESSVTLITGGFGTLKSLLMLKQAACIAQGEPCFEAEPPKARKVLYLYLESPGGIDSRKEAIQKDSGIECENVDVYFIIRPPNFFRQEEVQQIIDLIAHNKFELIIIDVALSVFGACSKKTSEDMGEFMANCRKIATETGSALGIVHHPPKNDSAGSHGGVEAFALADVWWVATKKEDIVTYRNKKQKEGDLVQDLKLTAKIVEISNGTSVVVQKHEKAPEEKFTENDYKFLLALQQVTDTMEMAVQAKDWKELAFSRSGLPRGSFGDSRIRLLNLGYVQKFGKPNIPTYSVSTAGVLKLQQIKKG